MRCSTADSASTQPGNHGDVHRGMPRSVINWHGGVLVVAGLCRMLFAITRTHRHTHTAVPGTGLRGETGGRGTDRDTKRRDGDMMVGLKGGISARAYQEQNSRESESKNQQCKVRK